MSAREDILERTRRALDDRPASPGTPLRPHSAGGGRDAAELFCERVADYQATVRRCAPAEVAGLVGESLSELGLRRLAVPQDFPEHWCPPEAELVPDIALTAAELDAVDGALTGCEVAIAETGTIVLRSGSAAQGRRALTLVPDLHVCVVGERQVVASVPEAIEALEQAARDGDPLTFVSGPSATSDIELSRVEGVHGPRTLHVIVVS